MYKTNEGDCWFEYTPIRNKDKFKQFSYLGNSVLIDSLQDHSNTKLVVVLDEEKFIA